MNNDKILDAINKDGEKQPWTAWDYVALVAMLLVIGVVLLDLWVLWL